MESSVELPGWNTNNSGSVVSGSNLMMKSLKSGLQGGSRCGCQVGVSLVQKQQLTI